MPLRLYEVSHTGQGQARRRLEAALHQHHYLGYRSRVGHNLQYWVCDRGTDLWVVWSLARRLGNVPCAISGLVGALPSVPGT